ncbi:Zn finger-containing GTPase- Activating Protein for ARF [Tulasnella sp. 418]|nr:Zn finger-containing GTPase- Activating Protein for ARF [Tulasnella sp. 418]
MDTWKEDQLARMKIGGNLPFRNFLKSYPDDGGYSEGMGLPELYHCWAATQYRDKLTADLEGRSWSPSHPPVNSVETPSVPASNQNLRKARASARTHSPSPLGNRSSTLSNSTPSGDDVKLANEAYFAGLGQTNAARPSGLPPSQGGRYEGFGSTPTPDASQHPSFGFSSANAPTLSDFQNDPVKALGKGWSLFAGMAAGATKVVAENVIQPAMDPSIRAAAAGYMSEATKRATDMASGANEWGKHQFGVDVMETVRSTVSGPSTGPYSSLPADQGRTFDGDDFFGEFDTAEASLEHQHGGSGSHGGSAVGSSSTTQSKATKKVDDEDDEWKDF